MRQQRTRHRVELNVRYREKDRAKSYGARWDPERKTWFTFTDNARLNELKGWLRCSVCGFVPHWEAFVIDDDRILCSKDGYQLVRKKMNELLETLEAPAAVDWDWYFEIDYEYFVGLRGCTGHEKAKDLLKKWNRERTPGYLSSTKRELAEIREFLATLRRAVEYASEGAKTALAVGEPSVRNGYISWHHLEDRQRLRVAWAHSQLGLEIESTIQRPYREFRIVEPITRLLYRTCQWLESREGIRKRELIEGQVQSINEQVLSQAPKEVPLPCNSTAA